LESDPAEKGGFENIFVKKLEREEEGEEEERESFWELWWPEE
jgi:hypothetical protein